MKKFTQAPLPFQGQKRGFAKQFINILPKFTDKTIFVDLFGGSGFLSHITKTNRPDAKVVYNDYDNYSERLTNIPCTNILLADLREIVAHVLSKARITGATREHIITRIAQAAATGYVDYITLSASILFSAKTATTLDELCKQGFYNRIRLSDYTADGYLEGVDIVSMDYRDLFAKYKDNPNVVFLVDPPYRYTDIMLYKTAA